MSTEIKYFNKKTREFVPAFFFNENDAKTANDVVAFAKQWGQLGISTARYSVGDTNAYGGWEGFKLITPTEAFEKSIYLVWDAKTLSFSYVTRDAFHQDYIEVTPENKEAIESIANQKKVNPS